MNVPNYPLKLANELYQMFISGPKKTSEYSIFLCGGSSPEEELLRRNIGDSIRKKISKYRYSVYYPENLFIELILGHHRKDLLSLENLLAESSNATAILLSSPGTFAELGAFTNHKGLKDKLVILIDPKYKNAKSFINLGPVRYLQKKTKSKICYMALDNSSKDKIATAITDSCRSFNSSINQTLSNPLLSIEFFLGVIYVFDPLPKDYLKEIAVALDKDNEENVSLAAETVLNWLVNDGLITYDSHLLSTTEKGAHDLLYLNRTKISRYMIENQLTKLRYEALNWMHRKGGAF
jgi:hypothetical protein